LLLRRSAAIGLWDGSGHGKSFCIRVLPEATLKGLATEIAKETAYHVAPTLRTAGSGKSP
jgi:hypothetical protein